MNGKYFSRDPRVASNEAAKLYDGGDPYTLTSAEFDEPLPPGTYEGNDFGAGPFTYVPGEPGESMTSSSPIIYDDMPVAGQVPGSIPGEFPAADVFGDL